jgi:hypothetical protein
MLKCPKVAPVDSSIINDLESSSKIFTPTQVSGIFSKSKTTIDRANMQPDIKNAGAHKFINSSSPPRPELALR